MPRAAVPDRYQVARADRSRPRGVDGLPPVRPDRRRFLAGALAAPLLPLSTGCSSPAPRWERAAVRQQRESHVAILGAHDYAVPLVEIVRRGRKLVGVPGACKTSG